LAFYPVSFKMSGPGQENDEKYSLRCHPPHTPAQRKFGGPNLNLHPLIVWAGHNIILDGHNRWAICNEHDIPFCTVDLELPDREAARNWLIQRQLSRRNLSPAGASYLRGKRYLAERGTKGGDHTSAGANCQNDSLLPSDPNTERRLAEEFRVSTRTIHRDAEFAAAVDTLAVNCGDQIRSLILSGDARLTRQQMTRLVQLVAEEQKRVVQQFQSGGRLPRLPRPPKRILAADEPAALAGALLRRLGPEQAALVYHQLGALLRQYAPGETKLKTPA